MGLNPMIYILVSAVCAGVSVFTAFFALREKQVDVRKARVKAGEAVAPYNVESEAVGNTWAAQLNVTPPLENVVWMKEFQGKRQQTPSGMNPNGSPKGNPLMEAAAAR
jgi:hypothetical protein